MMKFISLLSFLILSSCSSIKSFNHLFDSTRGVDKEFKIIWAKNLDPVYETGNLPISLQSPLIKDGLVFVGDNNGYFRSFELENGREVWKSKERSEFHSKPIAYKDQVIYGNADGRVFSRNLVTGEEKFSVDLGASVETEGVIFNGKLFFQLRNHQVFSLDAETGKILWAYKRSVPYLTTLQRASKPVVYDNRVYVGFADGTLAALNIEEGLLLFEVKLSSGLKFVDLDNPVIIIDGKLYASVMGGDLHIVNAENGSIIKRSEIKPSRAPFVLNDQELLIPTYNGSIVKTDKLLSPIREVKLVKGAVSDLKKFNNHLVLTSTEGEVKEIDSSTFEVLRSKNLGHSYSAVFGEIDIVDGHLALMSSRNRLYIIK